MSKAHDTYTMGDIKRLKYNLLRLDGHGGMLEVTESVREGIEMVDYILAAGRSLGVDTRNFNFFEHFRAGSTKPYRVISDRAFIVQKLQDYRAKIVADSGVSDLTVEEIAEIGKLGVSDLQMALSSAESSMGEYTSRMERSYRDFIRQAERVQEVNNKILGIEAKIAEEDGEAGPMFGYIQDIVSTGLWIYLGMDDDKCFFATRDEVIINKINFGFMCFYIEITRSGVFKIKGTKGGLGSRVINSYWHPHVGSDGTICWGNISYTVTDLLEAKQYGKVFSLLHQLITSYCAENPYIQLVRFKNRPVSMAFNVILKFYYIREHKYKLEKVWFDDHVINLLEDYIYLFITNANDELRPRSGSDLLTLIREWPTTQEAIVSVEVYSKTITPDDTDVDIDDEDIDDEDIAIGVVEDEDDEEWPDV